LLPNALHAGRSGTANNSASDMIADDPHDTLNFHRYSIQPERAPRF
jgi:hypothetical protein